VKVCTKCRLKKNETEFYLEKAKRKDGSIREFRRSHCRACETARKRKADKRTTKERAEYHQLKKYGITLDIKEMILKNQGGHCALCPKKEPGGRHNKWHTDHCHETGAIRGVLCDRCNRGIGMLGDSAERLLRASQYVAHSRPLELIQQRLSPMGNCDYYVRESLLDQDQRD
jgi:hypothetical protein